MTPERSFRAPDWRRAPSRMWLSLKLSIRRRRPEMHAIERQWPSPASLVVQPAVALVQFSQEEPTQSSMHKLNII
jgi:hypothetical protein